jgi:hypothetical protein
MQFVLMFGVMLILPIHLLGLCFVAEGLLGKSGFRLKLLV